MTNALTINYAIALLDASKEEKKDLYLLEKEVSFCVEIFKNNRDLARFLELTTVTNEEKYKVIDNVFKDFDSIIINFIKLIVLRSRAHYIYDIFKEAEKKFNAYLKVEKVIVYSSEPLSIENLEKIKKALESKNNKRYELKNEIDKALIGGIKVVTENDIYDASIKQKIESMKKALLKGGNWYAN